MALASHLVRAGPLSACCSQTFVSNASHLLSLPRARCALHHLSLLLHSALWVPSCPKNRKKDAQRASARLHDSTLVGKMGSRSPSRSRSRSRGRSPPRRSPSGSPRRRSPSRSRSPADGSPRRRSRTRSPSPIETEHMSITDDDAAFVLGKVCTRLSRPRPPAERCRKRGRVCRCVVHTEDPGAASPTEQSSATRNLAEGRLPRRRAFSEHGAL